MSISTRLLTINGVALNMAHVRCLDCNLRGEVCAVFDDNRRQLLFVTDLYTEASYVLNKIMTKFIDKTDVIITDDELDCYIKEAKKNTGGKQPKHIVIEKTLC